MVVEVISELDPDRLVHCFPFLLEQELELLWEKVGLRASGNDARNPTVTESQIAPGR